MQRHRDEPQAAGGADSADAPPFLAHDTPDAGTHVITVTGEIDLYSASDLKAAVVAAIDGGARRLVLDLTATGFVDSAALAVLISAHKRLRLVHGRLLIVNTQPSTAKVFSVTGLDRVFSIVETRDAALEQLSE